MNLTTLSKNFFFRRNEEKSIIESFFPKDITIESEVSSIIKRIRSFTDKKDDSKESGATGWEYAFNIVFLIDKLYTSKAVSGDYSSVSVNNKISLDPEYSDGNKKVKFKLTIGEKQYSTSNYETQKLNKGGNLPFGLVGTFHTHPRYYQEKGEFIYSFFSPQDIASLVRGGGFLSGLIAGGDVWLAMAGDDAEMIDPGLLGQATNLEYTEGEEAVVNFVRSEMKSFGVVFYHGKIGGKLKRV